MMAEEWDVSMAAETENCASRRQVNSNKHTDVYTSDDKSAAPRRNSRLLLDETLAPD